MTLKERLGLDKEAEKDLPAPGANMEKLMKKVKASSTAPCPGSKSRSGGKGQGLGRGKGKGPMGKPFEKKGGLEAVVEKLAARAPSAEAPGPPPPRFSPASGTPGWVMDKPSKRLEILNGRPFGERGGIPRRSALGRPPGIVKKGSLDALIEKIGARKSGKRTPFLRKTIHDKSKNPRKVKEIYRAIKRDHPEYPAAFKARIAFDKGSRRAADRKEGPPYTAPLSKAAGLDSIIDKLGEKLREVSVGRKGKVVKAPPREGASPEEIADWKAGREPEAIKSISRKLGVETSKELPSKKPKWMKGRLGGVFRTR